MTQRLHPSKYLLALASQEYKAGDEAPEKAARAVNKRMGPPRGTTLA